MQNRLTEDAELRWIETHLCGPCLIVKRKIIQHTTFYEHGESSREPVNLDYSVRALIISRALRRGKLLGFGQNASAIIPEFHEYTI